MNKQTLKSLLGKDAVEEVLSQLEAHARHTGKKDLLNQVILQQNKALGYRRHKQNDTLPAAEIQRLKNQVIEGILSIIDEIEDEEISPIGQSIAGKRLAWIIPLSLILIVIGYVAYRFLPGIHTAPLNTTTEAVSSTPSGSGATGQVTFPNGSVLSFRSTGGQEARYTLSGGHTEPADEHKVYLTLNVHCENQDDYPINFWDSSFRLKDDASGQSLAPISGLNEIAEARSSQKGDVIFELLNNKSDRFTLEVKSPFDPQQKRQLTLLLQ